MWVQVRVWAADGWLDGEVESWTDGWASMSSICVTTKPTNKNRAHIFVFFLLFFYYFYT